MPRQTKDEALVEALRESIQSSRRITPDSNRRVMVEAILAACEGRTGVFTVGVGSSAQNVRIVATGDSTAVEMVGVTNKSEARAMFYNGGAFWLLHAPHDGESLCACGSKDVSGGNADYDPTYAQRYGKSGMELFAIVRGCELGQKAQKGLIKRVEANGSWWAILPQRMSGSLIRPKK